MFAHSELFESARKRLPSLTARQQKVAHYLVRNPSACAFKSAREISKDIGVSEATVIRTAVALGYDGFSDMQDRARQEMIKHRTFGKMMYSVAATDGSEDVFTKSMRLDLENLEHTLIKIDPQSVTRAADLLTSASEVYVTGFRTAHGIAGWLTFCLQQLLGLGRLLDANGFNDGYTVLRSVGPGTVLVAIAFSRYTRETVVFSQLAAKRRGHVIAITDTELSPLAECADVVLCAEGASRFHADSLVGAMAIGNGLLSTLTVRQRERVGKKLEDLERLFKAEDGMAFPFYNSSSRR